MTFEVFVGGSSSPTMVEEDAGRTAYCVERADAGTIAREGNELVLTITKFTFRYSDTCSGWHIGHFITESGAPPAKVTPIRMKAGGGTPVEWPDLGGRGDQVGFNEFLPWGSDTRSVTFS
eukprot:CAMPEP_0119131962 /NCGR_PEP_ID=MMETSP1310-20130426/11039_1 /TAXON_ID=464262 /ORGANISM="Genus nov. species nov., Strain RCC2339" /LENGTH=119 /DNA_ID=CAMNT_0007122565 /DNA_START=232 /DNA_END=591 /DNA_ORIENTATION=-